MATYKKRGFKNRASKGKLGDIETKSTTASVFNTLDEGSSKTQKGLKKSKYYFIPCCLYLYFCFSFFWLH